MVRISRWMARSLHELAARIERWSGAASTPPPVAPPLPDPTMQALAERFPGAPDHWLRLVASRTGTDALGAVMGSARPIAEARQSATASTRNRLPQPTRPRRWTMPFSIGRPKAQQRINAFAPPDEVGPRIREPLARVPNNARGPVQHAGPELPASPGDLRFATAFPAPTRSSAWPSQGQALPRSRGHSPAEMAFPERVAARTRAELALMQDNLTAGARYPAQAPQRDDPALRPGFSAIGGDWRSGYEIRQPDELRNIWPTLPPSELSIPDAQPLLPDEDAIRLEQMVARWSA